MEAIVRIKRHARGVALILAVAAISAACDRSSELPFGGDPGGERSIAYLKSLCNGASTTVTQQLIVKGHVVGNDHFNEFYKTLVIEDASGGISIAVDRTDIADLFPFGAEVKVSCNSLTLIDYGGKIVLGTAPDENGPGRIPAEEVSRYIRRVSPGEAALYGKKIALNELSPQDADTYVRLDGVRFLHTGAWCDLDPETLRPVNTEREIVCADGSVFRVRTLGVCSYAEESVPTGEGTLYGVIDYFNGKYTLRTTNRGVDFVIAARRSTAYP